MDRKALPQERRGLHRPPTTGHPRPLPPSVLKMLSGPHPRCRAQRWPQGTDGLPTSKLTRSAKLHDLPEARPRLDRNKAPEVSQSNPRGRQRTGATQCSGQQVKVQPSTRRCPGGQHTALPERVPARPWALPRQKGERVSSRAGVGGQGHLTSAPAGGPAPGLLHHLLRKPAGP